MKHFSIFIMALSITANIAMSDDKPELSSDIKVAHAAIVRLREARDFNALVNVISTSRLHVARVEAIFALQGCDRQATQYLLHQLAKENVELMEGGSEDRIMKAELKNAMSQTIASNLGISGPNDQSTESITAFQQLAQSKLSK
jgi:hypothetical protein